MISRSNKIDFKWIEFLIEWIINGLDHRKNGLDHKNWIFCPPLTETDLSKIIHIQPIHTTSKPLQRPFEYQTLILSKYSHQLHPIEPITYNFY